jgi:putative ABC transport system permease protein
MFRMSRAGLAERWPLFVGALLAVSLGVALVQSSLLLLISAALLRAPAGSSPAEQLAFGNDAEAAVALLGIVLGVATFLAGFVISSTFAFTVSQRRADLALLRLVGGSRGQLRRLLLGEAVLLGTLGAALGVPTGLGVMAVQTRLLRSQRFVPETFTAQWRPWILFVSVGTGIVLAVAGVLVAAHRAGRVRPLEALRDIGAAARVMTVGRWIAGLLFLGGALAMMIVAPHAGPAGAAAIASVVAMPAAIALAALAPLLVPVVGRLIPTGAGAIGGLARANLWDGRRRSASVAAPLIVLIGLVIGIDTAGASFTTAGVQQDQRDTRADLVVTAPGPIADAVARVPGVDHASTETAVLVKATVGAGEDAETETFTALVVDPAVYARVHVSSGSLTALRGKAGIVGPGGGLPHNGTVAIRTATTDLGRLPMVGAVPEGASGGAELLLPAGVIPAAELASAPTVSYIVLRPDADPAAVRSALATVGTVTELNRWLAEDAAARADTNDRVMLIILGLGGLYAVIGVVNSVVIGAAARRREFAAARVTGLTRGQVVRSALLESSAVTLAGAVLGALAASAPGISVLAATAAVTGHASLDIPWRLVAAVGVVAAVVTSLTSVLSTWSATRPAPVALLGARE